jgi:hypothetical protein
MGDFRMSGIEGALSALAVLQLMLIVLLLAKCLRGAGK